LRSLAAWCRSSANSAPCNSGKNQKSEHSSGSEHLLALSALMLFRQFFSKHYNVQEAGCCSQLVYVEFATGCSSAHTI
jgi:hypothetical protein